MFDEDVIKAYRKSTAPAELKERVMKTYQTGNAKSNNVHWYKTFQTVAACLVLILSVTAFLNQQSGKIFISMSGNQVTEQPMPVISANNQDTNGVAMASFERSVEPLMCVPLEMKISSETTLSVSNGEMQVYAAANGELLFAGTEYATKEDIRVDWYLNQYLPDNEELPHLSLYQKGTEKILQLEYSEADGSWMIYER